MDSLQGKHLFGMVKVGEKGQIVIPKDARNLFKIKPGDQLMLVGDESSGLAIITSEKMKTIFASILDGTIKRDDIK
jgi:AbrB family looped-hinge helix DNA binding protein